MIIMLDVLIVEDEAIVAWGIQTILEKQGYRVIGIVASGEEAIQQAITAQPAVVVMDIHIPGAIDGIEAARTIQHQLEIPVVFVTAHTDEITVDRAMTISPFGYIVKPFLPEQLQTAVDLAITRYRSMKQLEQEMQALERLLHDPVAYEGNK
ncbi:response regulator [Trichothermofontia sichuanensis B231]|uniref:response regulator n=1 Tax=Trichothermofontia sichuanensis TaxID=3045816 RepID=UPI0022470D83|nr:response regulator [Trichothermofontia sichuanensis]UZQ53381.1 response regulator [Trichothermofontia sichuanensis B231]